MFVLNAVMVIGFMLYDEHKRPNYRSFLSLQCAKQTSEKCNVHHVPLPQVVQSSYVKKGIFNAVRYFGVFLCSKIILILELRCVLKSENFHAGWVFLRFVNKSCQQICNAESLSQNFINHWKYSSHLLYSKRIFLKHLHSWAIINGFGYTHARVCVGEK